MRSTDARWHLAVEALARMPELAHRLVEVHQADDRGTCRGCTVPGGTLFVRWPCGLYRLASASSASGAPADAAASAPAAAATPPAPTAPPRPEDEPAQGYAFGAGRKSAFGPGRRRPDPATGDS
jgi:hypothetical protein